MFVVTVTFVIAQEHVEEFTAHMLENAKTSLSEEPQCRRFDVAQHPDRPNEIFLYELYDSAAAFEHHKSMAHFLEFSRIVEPMVTSKSVQTYQLLGQ